MLVETYENIINTHINNYLGIFMRDKWEPNEEQLKELLLVTNVIIGVPISEECNVLGMLLLIGGSDLARGVKSWKQSWIVKPSEQDKI
jgi:hypothetical protein